MTPLAAWSMGGGNLTAPTGREALSHTKLQAFLSCPQKYDFHYRQRLRLRTTPTPLTLGRAYQLSIQMSDPGAGVTALREAVKVSKQADEDRLRVWETIVHSASDLYLSLWPGKGGVREYEYLVRLRDPATGYLSRDWDLHGYADEVVFGQDFATLIENKLVGQITELQIRKLPLDRQLLLERYGVWRATGAQVRQVKYRMVRKPSIKQRQGESVDDYCERIVRDYTERESFYAHEEVLLCAHEDLERVEGELWQWGRQLKALGAEDVTRNTTQCTEYGGCAYIPMCLGEHGAPGLYEIAPKSEVARPQAV